ncbi:MAG: hypothetical protein KBA61_12240 [Spirochaetes bacterium]|nr:hypothetical protein [Spirochaetota bacterium]
MLDADSHRPILDAMFRYSTSERSFPGFVPSTVQYGMPSISFAISSSDNSYRVMPTSLLSNE